MHGLPERHRGDERLRGRKIRANSFCGSHLPRSRCPAPRYCATCKSGLLPVLHLGYARRASTLVRVGRIYLVEIARITSGATSRTMDCQGSCDLSLCVLQLSGAWDWGTQPLNTSAAELLVRPIPSKNPSLVHDTAPIPAPKPAPPAPEGEIMPGSGYPAVARAVPILQCPSFGARPQLPGQLPGPAP